MSMKDALEAYQEAATNGERLTVLDRFADYNLDPKDAEIMKKQVRNCLLDLSFPS